MGLFSWLRGPRAATQSATGGKRITTSEDLAVAMRLAMRETMAGVDVTPDSAMRVAAVYAAVRLISGAVANLPIHVQRRVDAATRVNVDDTPVAQVLRRRPNNWQTPSQFRRMMTAHVLLRGNAYAQIIRAGSRVVSLLPLDPDRMRVEQSDNGSIVYTYHMKSGAEVRFNQREILHLVGLSLDGVNGVSALTYAREAIGLSMAQENHGATTFKNAARPSSVLKHPGRLGPEAANNLRTSLDAYRNGGAREGSALVLEEGMDIAPLSMTAEDAQWIESRKFSRTDIAMFFGVPPHMLGDTEKSTSWGSGIEQQSIGFVTYTLEDYLTAWEETINRDLIDAADIYARFNRKALIRGDIKTRQAFYVSMMQWGVYSPDEIRALEDENPRPDGQGGVYYDPPNTAGGSGGNGGENDNQSNPED